MYRVLNVERIGSIRLVLLSQKDVECHWLEDGGSSTAKRLNRD